MNIRCIFNRHDFICTSLSTINGGSHGITASWRKCNRCGRIEFYDNLKFIWTQSLPLEEGSKVSDNIDEVGGE